MDDQNSNDDDLPQFKWKHFWWFVSIAGAIIVFVFGFYVANFPFGISADQNSWGTFGDFIGGTLNPLLAFMGLIALLYTIIIQSTELKETRKELKNSSKALHAQSESLKLQNFETTFFNLLNFHSQQMNIINLKDSSNSRTRFRGGDVFKYLYESHIKNYMQNSKEKDFKTKMLHVNNNLNHHFSLQLNNFFNQVLIIFNLINTNSIFENRKLLKADYFNILKMQYSTYHLSLIYIHFCNNSYPEYYDPLRESEFFKEINKGDIPSLFSYLREKYGSSSKEGLIDLIIDLNDESSEKCK